MSEDSPEEPKQAVVIPMRSTLRDIVGGTQDEFESPGFISFSRDEEKRLQEMNQKHAVIANYHGRPMILTPVRCEVTGRMREDFMTPEAFAFMYCNQSIPISLPNGKDMILELGKWWTKHLKRREYPSVTFDPKSNERDQYGAKVSNGLLNMWTGLGVEPKKGDWRRMKRHIYDVLSNKNPAQFKYLMRWLAWAVQNPDKPAEVAVVFKGKKGSGKGVLANAMVKIFGLHGTAISNRKHLTGQFNEHLDITCFLFADEAYYPGDKEVEGVLKSIITEPTIQVEGKFKKTKAYNNRLKIIMCTNEQWVVSASADERRFYITDTADTYTKVGKKGRRRAKYFDRIFAEMKGDGIRAMLHDLLNMKLENWHPRYDVPETTEYKKQVFQSLNYAQKGVYEFIVDGVFPGTNKLECTGANLWAQIKLIYPEIEKANTLAKVEAIKSIGAQKKRTAKGIMWTFPDLYTCRMNYVAAFGQPPEPFSVDDTSEWQYKSVENEF